MRERIASFFLLVPGPWESAEKVVSALGRHGIAALASSSTPIASGQVLVQVVDDDDLAQGFAWGRAGRLPSDLVARVGACSRAAVIECGQRFDENPSRIVALGRALQAEGGVAVRTEGSGAASEWEPWLERLESGSAFDLYESAVLLVGDDDDVFFTCGMHHFDLPDAQIAMPDARAASAWLDAFCVYQLAEHPALASGHTFAPTREDERRAMVRWPDHRHDPNDGRHNPFGVWRFAEPGAASIESSALVPTPIPSLSALLKATEDSQSRSLSAAEVEAIVGQCACVAMDPRDVAALERSRGYADIEPELAWEQWQIVRAWR